MDEKKQKAGEKLVLKHIEDGIGNAISVGISTGAFEDFNRRLIMAGLVPDAVGDLSPITVQLGLWMGKNIRMGISLNDAIAELDVVAGAPLETLLAEATDREDRISAIMLKATLHALELCCLPGRVVEAATFIIQTTSGVLDSALDEHLPA